MEVPQGRQGYFFWANSSGMFGTEDFFRKICYGRILPEDLLRKILSGRFVTEEFFHWTRRFVTEEFFRKILYGRWIPRRSLGARTADKGRWRSARQESGEEAQGCTLSLIYFCELFFDTPFNMVGSVPSLSPRHRSPIPYLIRVTGGRRCRAR